MSPAPITDSVVRRLFSKENGPVPAAAKDVASTVDRIQQASSEMRKLRTKVAEQHKAFWDQKGDLADVRRQLAEAMAASLKSDKAFQIEKARAELAEGRCQQLERDATALRQQIDSLLEAINTSFQFDDPRGPEEENAMAGPTRTPSLARTAAAC